MILKDLLKTNNEKALLYILKNDGYGNYSANYFASGKCGWETETAFMLHGYSAEWLEFPVVDFARVEIEWSDGNSSQGLMIWIGEEQKWGGEREFRKVTKRP